MELAAMSKEGGRVLSGNGKLSKFELTGVNIFYPGFRCYLQEVSFL